MSDESGLKFSKDDIDYLAGKEVTSPRLFSHEVSPRMIRDIHLLDTDNKWKVYFDLHMRTCGHDTSMIFPMSGTVRIGDGSLVSFSVKQ